MKSRQAVCTIALCSILAACGAEGPEPASGSGLAKMGETERARMRQARAASAVTLGAQARQAIQQYYTMRGRFPTSNGEAGLAQPSAYQTGVVSSMTVSGEGTRTQVTIAFTDKVEAGKTLVWEATAESGRVLWRCTGGTLSPQYRPAGCR